MKKKITITANADGIKAILDSLSISEITFETFVEGDSNKEICKKLSGIDEIKDWDFVESGISISNSFNYDGLKLTSEQEPEEILCSSEEVKKNTFDAIEKFKESLDIDVPGEFNLEKTYNALVESDISIPSVNELATFIEAVWKAGKNTISGFGPNFIKYHLKDSYNEVAMSAADINHAMIGMMLSTYYGEASIEESIKDSLQKISSVWKNRSEFTGIAGFVYKMYKKITPENK